MVVKKELNQQQKEAVELVGSPLLIFAGAGSGKTRVLTEKIGYLIEELGMPPEHILAVTFTNKAAAEMKERVQSLITQDISKMTIGTFHSVCAGFLRKHINIIGYDNNFTIYDQSDSKQLVKTVISDMNLDSKTFQANKYQYLISNLKNKMIYPDDVLLNTDSYIDEVLRDIYLNYNKRLKENNATDFDDLLLLPLEIFRTSKSLLKKYQQKFQYVLVDEYQDTNKPQFEFIYNMSKNNNEITVVGDDDQSIYAWRGADISNILNFSSSFSNSLTIKLEQNYRSTKVILDVAHSVVSKNENRADKKLWTDNPKGELILLNEYENEINEAQGVIKSVLNKVKNDQNLNDMVILYRTNTQSRVVEDQLRRESIPYHIVGGIKFYDRKEIKDILAYLKYIVNPSDSIAFTRIINFPPRGIGKTTINKLFSYMNDNQVSLEKALNHLDKISLGENQTKQINKFRIMMNDLQKSTNQSSLVIVEKLIKEIDLKEYYTNKDNPEDLERLENIDELILSISDFCDRNDENSVNLFIEEVSLLTDIDRWNADEQKLTLMTLHSSKGLEFNQVFILGLEEGLLPLIRGDDDDIEEERRLFYVGITRGIKTVELSYANSRRRYGSSSIFSLRSSFIDDIPESLYHYNRNSPTTTFHKEETPIAKTDRDELEVNDIVQHKLYGRGIIIHIKGIGENSKISIKFRGNEIKKFIKKYANLKKIS